MTPSNIKRLCSFAFIAFLIVVLTGPQTAGAQGPVPVTTGPFIAPLVKGVPFTGDLRKVPKTKVQPVPLPSPLMSAPSGAPQRQPSAPFQDPVRQAVLAPLSMPVPVKSFDGLNDVNWGARLQPDSNGDVGPNHFVQGVNMALGVYDKNGNFITAVTLNDWWYQPAKSTACYTKNHIGDPIVVYNYLADRWAVIDIAIENWNPGPMWLCLAVSMSGDPVAGGWWFYAFNPDPTKTYMFPDEPRLGVWPDGLYAAALMRDSTANYAWRSYRAWAMDWNSILNGSFRTISFDTNVQPDFVHSIWMLPGNTRRTLPPPGTPNFFGAVWDPSTFWLWKFHVDWTNLNNSTFLGPTTLTTAPFSSSFSTTVPEPSGGAINPFVDNRLLLQLQYRNIGGVQSLWGNHAVLTNGVTGLRWYQITDPNGTPTIAQQGTWQPDNNYRMQGSMAVDGNGDMALSYTTSSATISPTIQYAGRLPSDAPGTLGQGEGTLIAGAGIQTGSDPGWGNYFSTTVDPIDDCTFWFTNKYYTTTTVSNTWQTRIGAFKFPACNPTPYPTNHTVTFDGVVNPNIEWNPNSDKLGTMGGIDYYATWDANHLSVAMVGGAVNTNTYVVAVDTDPSNRTSTNTGTAGNLICAGFNGNGKGNFALARSGVGTGKSQVSGGAWAAWAPSANTDAKDNGSNNVEFQLQWSDLGLPPTNSSVGLYLYVCNRTNLVSAWPPENVQTGTNPVLNTEVVFSTNDAGRIPRTYARHVGDQQLTISTGGPFKLLNGYVQLANVSGVSSCVFTASVNGNADTTDPNTIRRTYVLTPGCTGLTADLTLKYEDGTMLNNAPSELVAFTESSLKLLRWSGTSWSPLPTTVDTVNNAATTTSVSQFSPWSLGKGAPTAVTISSFTAVPLTKGEAGSQVVLGLGLVEVLVLGLVVSKKSVVRH